MNFNFEDAHGDELAKQEEAAQARQAEWAQGLHTNSKGVQVNLADQPATYLKNIANKFRDVLDVSVIDAAFEKRIADDAENSQSDTGN